MMTQESAHRSAISHLRVAFGCDEAALPLAATLREHLSNITTVRVDLLDFGTFSAEPIDYPDIAEAVAVAICTGKADRGILLCGTGIGMAIAANKVPGIRAACCHDTYSAERARRSNDAQVLTMGARVIGPELARTVLDSWLSADFSGGNSLRKVEKITALEQRSRVSDSGGVSPDL